MTQIIFYQVLGIQTYQHVSSIPLVSAISGVVGEVETQEKPREGVTTDGPEVTLEEEEEPEVTSKLPPPQREGNQKTEVPKKTLIEREEEKALEGLPKDACKILKVWHTSHIA